MNAQGPLLDELGKRLMRSQGWSGFVRADTRALAAAEDERGIRLSLKAGRRGIKEKAERVKEGERPSKCSRVTENLKETPAPFSSFLMSVFCLLLTVHLLCTGHKSILRAVV